MNLHQVWIQTQGLNVLGPLAAWFFFLLFFFSVPTVQKVMLIHIQTLTIENIDDHPHDKGAETSGLIKYAHL